MKKILLFAVAALLLGACSKNNDDSPKTYTVTVNVTFKDARDATELVQGEFDEQRVHLGLNEEGGEEIIKENISDNPSSFVFKNIEEGHKFYRIYVTATLKNGGGRYEDMNTPHITVSKDTAFNFTAVKTK